jgi:hypothetical protein
MQSALTDAFAFETILYQKALDRLTNACFQSNESIRLSRKDVESSLENKPIRPEKKRINESAEEDHPPPKRKQPKRRKIEPSAYEVKTPGGKGTFERIGSKVPAPLQELNYSFPVLVNNRKMNCLMGNIINLLHYLGHYEGEVRTSLSITPISPDLPDISKILKRCGFQIINLPGHLGIRDLDEIIRQIHLPLIISGKVYGSNIEHVIGVTPFRNAMTAVNHPSSLDHHIIDGAHPFRMPMKYSIENLHWCYFQFVQMRCGFFIYPGRSRSEVENSWLSRSSLTPICLFPRRKNLPPWVQSLNIITAPFESYVSKLKHIIRNK